MTAILEEVKLTPIEEQAITSERTKRFVKLSKLIEQMEREKENAYLELSEEEKQEAFESLQKQHNIPDYITVRDAAKILDVSVQMVRRYCTEGKINAFQRLEGSGKWLIETKQFIDNKNWGKFVQERARIKDNSLKFANKMLDIMDDDSE
ncbi:helix-turn-helix domain-containing protein [Metabacillus sp. Hm71]|uniref:helix-turn-helix domain-containing protein n=1 Tax=Metabacillus sp. Hm71 TaxID=3450743 RepID=UPI003F438AB2